MTHRRLPSLRRQRGSAYIAAAWIIIALVAMTLILVNRMRVETTASTAQTAQLQADAVERGGEQYVIAQADNSDGNALTVTGAPAAAIQIRDGGGYFWILSPNPDDDQTYGYGITDEASKINLNATTPTNDSMLLGLASQMAADVPDSIVMWHSPQGTATANGAGESYYSSLKPDPYDLKCSNFESVDELLLVEGITPDLLYGLDQNRDGIIDAGEAATVATTAPASSGSGMPGLLGPNAGGSTFGALPDDRRGIYNYLTVWTTEPNTSATGSARINVNNPTATNRLTNYLTQTLGASRSAAIMLVVNSSFGDGRRVRPTPFVNMFDFDIRAALTPTEFNTVYDKLTTSAATTRTGMINVNTASMRVLSCLPGLTASDAQSIITARQAVTDPTNTIAWIINALPPIKLVGIGSQITGRSYQFSADIVGVSGDGRAYKRVRIVIDASKSPPTLLYRKELTDLGWPLDPAIRTALRSGQGIQAAPAANTGGI